MPADVAFKLKLLPAVFPDELALNVMVELATSVMDTFPVDAAVKLVAFMVPAPLNAMPPAPALTLTVEAFNAPTALIPAAPLDAFRVNDDPELAPRLTKPAKVSLMFTAPVMSETVKLLAFNEPEVLKSTPPAPEVKLTVGAASAPVALMPPAAFVVLSVNELAELAPRETMPTKESLTTTVPVASVITKLLALRVPAVLKSTPAEPALRLTDAALRFPVALMPLAPFDALRVNNVAELAPSAIAPAFVSFTLTAPFALASVSVEAFTEPVVAKSIPPEPALKDVFAELILPLPVMPLVALEAVKLKVVPELLRTEMLPAAVSVSCVVPPVELACNTVAFVPAMLMPPAAAVMVNEGVLSPVAMLVEVTLPLTADSTIEPVAL